MPLPSSLRFYRKDYFSISFHALSIYGLVLLYSMISVFPRYGSLNIRFIFRIRLSFFL